MKYLVVLSGLLLLCACTEAVVEKPEDLIPEAEMVDIYFDISLINASRNSGYDKFLEYGVDTRDYLYKKFDIDSARLASSSAFYTSKPLVHERIYTRVEEKLDSLKALLDEQLSEVQKDRSEALRSADSAAMQKDSADVPEASQKDTLDTSPVSEKDSVDAAGSPEKDSLDLPDRSEKDSI